MTKLELQPDSIKFLSREVSSQLRSGIATPSVVQCVEELVVNSIDAGASYIAVRVDLPNYKIQVIDNGRGIAQESLPLVGERYASSKCHGVKDLENLSYYGYRGEALASIRDVTSVLEIESRVRGSDVAYCKLFRHGKNVGVSNSKSRPSGGTTITAHNVYYNMPVRQKMLSCPLVYEHLCKRLQAIALIHPNISLTLRDDSTGLKSIQTHNSTSVVNTFGYLFGKELGDCLKDASWVHGHFNISGFIGIKSQWNKSLQFLYVNGRLVLKTKLHRLANELLGHSLITKNRMNLGSNRDATREPNPATCKPSPGGTPTEYAIFVLNVTCPRTEYDITLDPAKTLVEFRDWDGALVCLQELIKSFLHRENLTMKLSPSLELNAKETGVASRDHVSESAESGVFVDTISTSNCWNAVESTCVRRQKSAVDGQEGSCAVDDKLNEHASGIIGIQSSGEEPLCNSGKYPPSTSSCSFEVTPAAASCTDCTAHRTAEPDSTVPQNSPKIIHSQCTADDKLTPSNLHTEVKSPCVSDCTPVPIRDDISCDNGNVNLPTAEEDVLCNSNGRCAVEDGVCLPSSDPEQNFSDISASASSCCVATTVCSIANEDKQCNNPSSMDDMNVKTNADTAGIDNRCCVGREACQENTLSHRVVNSLSAFRRSVGKEKLIRSWGNNESQGSESEQRCFQIPQLGTAREHKTIALRWHRSPGFRSRLAGFNIKCQDRQDDGRVPLGSVVCKKKQGPSGNVDMAGKALPETNAENKVYSEAFNKSCLPPDVQQMAQGRDSKHVKQQNSLNKQSSKEPAAEHTGTTDPVEEHLKLSSPPIPRPTCRKRNHLEDVSYLSNERKSTLGQTCARTHLPDHGISSKKPREFYTSNFLLTGNVVLHEKNEDLNINSLQQVCGDHLSPQRTKSGTDSIWRGNCTNTSDQDMDPFSVHTANKIAASRCKNKDYPDLQDKELPAAKVTNDADLNKATQEMGMGPVEMDTDTNRSLSHEAATADHSNDARTFGGKAGGVLERKGHLMLHDVPRSDPAISPCEDQMQLPEAECSLEQVAGDSSLQKSSHTASAVLNQAPNLDTILPSSIEASEESTFVQENREWYSVYDAYLGKKVFINRKNGNCSIEGPNERKEERCQDDQQSPEGFIIVTKRDTLAHPHLPHNAASFISRMRDHRAASTAAPGSMALDAMATVDAVLKDHEMDEAELWSVKWGHERTGDVDITEVSMTSCGQRETGPAFPTCTVGDRAAGVDAKFQAKVLASLNPCQFTKSMFNSIKVLGQVDAKFIACMVNSEHDKNPSGEPNLLVLIDQHAAHERIRLEMLIADAYNGDEGHEPSAVRTSTVTPPIPVRLSPSELRLLGAYRHKLETVGVAYTAPADDGDCVVKVTCLPACMVEREANELKRGRQTIATSMVETLIKEELDLLQRQSGAASSLPKTITRILNSQACHGAIKFGDILDLDECRILIGQLASCDLPFQCAHGRPALMPILDLKKLRLREMEQDVFPSLQLWKLKHQSNSAAS